MNPRKKRTGFESLEERANDLIEVLEDLEKAAKKHVEAGQTLEALKEEIDTHRESSKTLEDTNKVVGKTNQLFERASKALNTISDGLHAVPQGIKELLSAIGKTSFPQIQKDIAALEEHFQELKKELKVGIDKQIAGVVGEVVGGTKASISSLETKLDSIKKDDIGILEAKLDRMKDEDISALETKLDSIKKDDINSLRTSLDNLKTKLDDIQKKDMQRTHSEFKKLGERLEHRDQFLLAALLLVGILLIWIAANN